MYIFEVCNKEVLNDTKGNTVTFFNIIYYTDHIIRENIIIGYDFKQAEYYLDEEKRRYIANRL